MSNELLWGLASAAVFVAVFVGAQVEVRMARRRADGMCWLDDRCFLYAGHAGKCLTGPETREAP